MKHGLVLALYYTFTNVETILPFTENEHEFGIDWNKVLKFLFYLANDEILLRDINETFQTSFCHKRSFL